MMILGEKPYFLTFFPKNRKYQKHVFSHKSTVYLPNDVILF